MTHFWPPLTPQIDIDLQAVGAIMDVAGGVAEVDESPACLGVVGVAGQEFLQVVVHGKQGSVLEETL